MDVNEHEILSNVTDKLELRNSLYIAVYGSIFNNEHNSYPKMSMKHSPRLQLSGILYY
jgi:hypothetical protein